MQAFITGTDTNIGKTLICSWLCIHTKYPYFKPIQTGTVDGADKDFVSRVAKTHVYNESYRYKAPLSPHLAASLENEEIDIAKVLLPASHDLIIEGAGGVMVPINTKYLMVDLIKTLNIPVILVASTRLGTINHTLLSIEALRSRNIELLGIIMSGEINKDNSKSIASYGHTQILAEIPLFENIDYQSLAEVPFTKALENIFTGTL